MATRRSHRSETSPREETSTGHREDASGTNGNGSANGAAPATEQGQRPVMERAEEMADRVGERLGHFASLIGRKIVQFVARAREEAEDIWAEAQEIRRRRREEQSPPESSKE